MFVGEDLIHGVGWIDEVVIRFVARRDEGMVAIAQRDAGIAARLALRGSLGGMTG